MFTHQDSGDCSPNTQMKEKYGFYKKVYSNCVSDPLTM